MFGLVILTLLCLSAIFAPLLTPYDPDKVNLRERLHIPSLQHWMGTDELGRDVFTRVLYGGRISLTVGFVVAIIGTLIGGVIGATSGYVGGPVDEGAMRFVDVLRSLPTLPILIVLSQVLRCAIWRAGRHLDYRPDIDHLFVDRHCAASFAAILFLSSTLIMFLLQRVWGCRAKIL